MKNLAAQFLTEAEQQEIRTSVAAAEATTAGEIVCMIVSSSYHYPMADVLGATALGLPLALLATHYLGAWLWIGTGNMWLFLGLFTLLFAFFHRIMDYVPGLKRRFISRHEIDVEVEEAAITAFFRHGLYRTRDANGVLLFISVFERKVWLLADKGIHAKVPQAEWDALVAQVSGGIGRGERSRAICDAVEAIAGLLQAHFPIKPDDTNELRDLIVGEP